MLYSLWYRHTYRWPSGAQVERVLSQLVHPLYTELRIRVPIHILCSVCNKWHVTGCSLPLHEMLQHANRKYASKVVVNI